MGKRISIDEVESLGRFYQIPKIFTDCEFQYFEMSLDAKFAYAVLKDRFELSRKNGWIDEDRNVYLIFTITELEAILGCKHEKVIKIKKILAEYGLLEEVRQGLNKPNRLYLLNVDTEAKVRTSENRKSASDKDFRKSEILDSKGLPKIGNQDFRKSEANDTEYSDTEIKEILDDEEEIKTPAGDSDSHIMSVSEIEQCFPEFASEMKLVGAMTEKEQVVICTEISKELHETDPIFVVNNFNMAWDFTSDNVKVPEYFAQYLVQNMSNRFGLSKYDKLKNEHTPQFNIPIFGPWSKT
ncbi:MAG: replication initiator protein A [Streptococcaceae bacterium]|jgi:hypothetical protein|nr:replication initiator protein A [Streptococcaceae bacterium]